MPEGCIICETAFGSGPTHCPRCGFPAELTAELVMNRGWDEEGEESAVAPPSAGSAAPGEFEREEDEAGAAFALALGRALDLIGELGGDVGDLLGELRQAALLSAEGRGEETLTMLHHARVSANLRLGELFESRLSELEERQQGLIGQGFSPDLLQDAVRLRAEIAEAPVEEVAAHLADAERSLARMESEWQELRSNLLQIDEIRQGARALGHEAPGPEQALAAVRATLSGPALSSAELSGTLSESIRLLGSYHALLAPELQKELDRHARHLAQFAPDHASSRKARQLHADANRHLRGSRLAEATLRLGELREALTEVGGMPPTEPAPEAPAESVVEEPVGPLLARVRRLAGRIQELPPQSPLAEEAARRIREVTELLRERRLAEAGRTLTELMDTLDRPAPTE